MCGAFSEIADKLPSFGDGCRVQGDYCVLYGTSPSFTDSNFWTEEKINHDSDTASFNITNELSWYYLAMIAS